jgi:hypothetical protein
VPKRRLSLAATVDYLYDRNLVLGGLDRHNNLE